MHGANIAMDSRVAVPVVVVILACVTGRSAQVISVVGTVAFTGLSGVVFCEPRRRSGSLLAPAGLHWATNAIGVLASAAVWAWGTAR